MGSNWGGSHPDDQDRAAEEAIKRMREQYLREADSKRNQERAKEAEKILKRGRDAAKKRKQQEAKAAREIAKKNKAAQKAARKKNK